ncbi:MAG TPA: 2-oxoglutarate and iron-dependent oxygenase domain-containing protein [Acidimicrobiales bacterium]
MVAIPVHPIDLTPFREGGPDDKAEVARQIDDACRDTGFLLLSGHGIPAETADAVLDTCQAFFDLPLEEKRRYKVADPAANRGFTEMGEEALAYSRGEPAEESPPDLFEAFTMGRSPTSDPYYDVHRRDFAPNVWPERPAGLREAARAYERAARGTADIVLRAMALALDLEESWFIDRTRRSIVTTRALDYRRAPGQPDPAPGQMRLGAHTDFGIMTLLLADDVPGLQVCRDGEWFDVSIPPGTLVCNIGDMLERWTNDRWRSTLHRVVPPPREVSGPVRRRSLARFLDGEPDRVVECIPSCCGPDNPPRYPPVVGGEWLLAKVLSGRERKPAALPG